MPEHPRRDARPSGTQHLGPAPCWTGSHAGTLRFNSYSHVNTPNGLTCTNAGGEDPGGVNTAITAQSNHSGGVNVCMCDGSVRFVKDTINPQTWWAIGSRGHGRGARRQLVLRTVRTPAGADPAGTPRHVGGSSRPAGTSTPRAIARGHLSSGGI